MRQMAVNNGGGDGDDGLLGATAYANVVKLRLQIAALDAQGGSGDLDDDCFGPMAATAEPGTVARAQAGPGRLKARHVNADRGDGDMRGDLAHVGPEVVAGKVCTSRSGVPQAAKGAYTPPRLLVNIQIMRRGWRAARWSN